METIMGETQEKRMIANTAYEVRQAFRINGKEILIAEDQNAADGMTYMVYQYTNYGIIAEFARGFGYDDYLDALQDFTGRINTEAAAIRAERDALNLPAKLFTAEDCHPHSYDESIEGKVVAIKASVFSPEYRRGDSQIVYVTGGNGAREDPSGHAVYCYHLNDGRHTRFERYEVLGVVKEPPDWARKSLARIRSEMEKPVETKEFAGNYEIKERIEVGQKVFALGHCERAPNPYGTWRGYKNSKGNFDFGHYFNDYDAAKTDMRERAAKEQVRLDEKKRDAKGR
jgi:hypothetical protein